MRRKRLRVDGHIEAAPLELSRGGEPDSARAEYGHTAGVEQTVLPAGGRSLGVAFFEGGGSVEVVRTPDGTYYTGSPGSFERVPGYDRDLIRRFDKRFAALEKTARTGHPEIMTPRPAVPGATARECSNRAIVSRQYPTWRHDTTERATTPARAQASAAARPRGARRRSSTPPHTTIT